MARNCKHQLKLFFLYLKFNLLFSYNSTDLKLPKANRFSFISFALLCLSVLLYSYNAIGAIEKFVQVLQSDKIDENALKIDALIQSVKITLSIIMLWLLTFSFKSRRILERIVKYLQTVDDLVGQSMDRTRKINASVAGFLCIKLMLILACCPLFIRGGIPFVPLLLILNEMYVNCIEDSVEHIFVVFCAEIFGRLNHFKVKIKKSAINQVMQHALRECNAALHASLITLFLSDMKKVMLLFILGDCTRLEYAIKARK